ncbi:MAG: hypothetical protein WKF57_15250 [Nakamurella sp.]
MPTAPAVPGRPRTIWITGSSGVGKSTLAARLESEFGLPHLELDGLFHQAGWTPQDHEVMRSQVSEVLAQDTWVVDGNYSSVLGTLVRDRCQLQIALDLPTWLVMARITRRTLTRMATGQELWNGNTEPWSNLTSWDPETNILRWAWTKRHGYRAAARAAEISSGVDGPRCVRLTSPAQVERFVQYLRQA